MASNDDMQIHLLQEQILDLQEQVNQLHQRLLNQEAYFAIFNREQPKPVIDWPKLPDTIRFPETIRKSCPKCGISLEGVMSYCCQNIDCPTGLGPVYCKT
jgi:hypothetical protein